MNPKEEFRTDLARCRRKIEKYNQDLANYVYMTGDNEVPEVDCTIIGTSPMNPIVIAELPNGFAYTEDGLPQEIVIERIEGEWWFSGEDELDDLLKYNRRRIRKGIRVWKSDNPDRELEKDEE